MPKLSSPSATPSVALFPEFLYLDRLNRLNQICTHSQINKDVLLATLLIDEKDNQDYFSHKYNVSNNIKENLSLFAKNLKLLKNDNEFFDKDLEKNIYLYNKDYLINLNILNFTNNANYNFKYFSNILKKILQSKIYKLPVDGRYLIQNGMKEGAALGKVLKIIEKEWVSNNFKISKDKIEELIRLNSD